MHEKTSPPTPLRVLIVDDCADSAESFAMLINMWGHRTIVAYNGTTALRAAEVVTPDVVFLDLGLPGLDGCAVARELRRRPGLERALLVAVTGFADEDHRLRAREAGFDYYVLKPADLPALRRLLEALAGKAPLPPAPHAGGESVEAPFPCLSPREGPRGGWKTMNPATSAADRIVISARREAASAR
jgi:CheY-like chemotaxis protein